MLRDRVSILFGVPVDKEEFHARVEHSDWLTKYVPSDSADKTPGSDARKRHYDACWQGDYLHAVAAPLNRLIDRARELGATVRRQATLADLAGATAEARTETDIVVLMSHWKGPEFNHDDFPVPAHDADFVERARRDDSPVGRWLDRQFTANSIGAAVPPPRSSALARLWAAVTGAPKRMTLKEILRRSLDADIADAPASAAHANAYCEADITRLTRRRGHLDGLFDGLIRPGNRLELFDGLHAMDAIEPAIAPDFTGILDLTTCTSSSLADHISRQRQYRLRTVQFEDPQLLDWGADCISLALSLVADGQPYLQARMQAGKAMKHLVLDEARKRQNKGKGRTI